MVLVKFLLRQVVTCNTQEFKKRKESDREESKELEGIYAWNYFPCFSV